MGSMHSGGRCIKHDNWHATCVHCVEEDSFSAGEKSAYTHVVDWLRNSPQARELLEANHGIVAAELLADAIESNNLNMQDVQAPEPIKLCKGDTVRQPSTGRIGKITRIQNTAEKQIFVVDTCGTAGWYPLDQWTYHGIPPVTPKRLKSRR